MIIYERYKNKESLIEWAQRSLTSQELNQFNSAFTLNTELWKSYQLAGMCNTTDIWYSVYSSIFDCNIDIRIGEQLNSIANETLTVHPSFRPWLDRYMADVGSGAVIIKTATNN